MKTFFALLPGAGTRLSTLAIELPRSITPAIAGLTVGLFVGVVGVIAVIMFVARGTRRGTPARFDADEVVLIPPYGTMQRNTPLPPRAFANAGNSGSSGNLPAARANAYAHAYAHAPNAHHAPSVHAPVPGYGFRPSSALSARVFAKMRYSHDAGDEPVERDVARIVELPASPSSDPIVSIDVELADESAEFAAPASAVLVSPVVVLSAANAAPHPLGVISSTSPAMRPASIAELSFDDSPTEIGEPYFDESPRPRRRTDPPKIRPVTPAAPRFPEEPPRTARTARAPAGVATATNDRQHP
ncbi:MAG: hypothetical protein NVS3B10_13920 [Polyangiales bacterium]